MNYSIATSTENHANHKRSLSKRVRFFVLKRDNFTCVYCGRSASEVTLEIDHKIPVSRGGSNDVDNLVTACRSCNLGKSDILLEESPPLPVSRVDQPKIDRRAYLPKKDGKWWLTSSVLHHDCPNCGQDLLDRPGVMAYRVDLDHGGEQRRKHPGWNSKGWLWWAQCTHCGHTFFEAVDRKTVTSWGKQLGSWSLYGIRS